MQCTTNPPLLYTVSMQEKTFGEQVIDFYTDLSMPSGLSEDVSVMNPYAGGAVMKAVSVFYKKYFDDTDERVYIIGINPGRLGAGVTGIAFTDTKALEYCGIKNEVTETKELSAEFVYRVIEHYGGPEKFYKQFFIASICPVGFTKNGE